MRAMTEEEAAAYEEERRKEGEKKQEAEASGELPRLPEGAVEQYQAWWSGYRRRASQRKANRERDEEWAKRTRLCEHEKMCSLDIEEADREELNRRETMRVGWERPPRRESTKTRLLAEIKVREQEQAAASSPAAGRALQNSTNTSTAGDCGCVHGGGSNEQMELPPTAQTSQAGITNGAEAEGRTRGNEAVGMARLTTAAWRTLAASAAGGL